MTETHIIAPALAVLALCSLAGLWLLVGQYRRIASLERDVLGRIVPLEREVAVLASALAHGINRTDLDKLHHRVNVLVKEVGGMVSHIDSIDKHVQRLDDYMRSLR